MANAHVDSLPCSDEMATMRLHGGTYATPRSRVGGITLGDLRVWIYKVAVLRHKGVRQQTAGVK